jgi:hypothetical protein
MRSDTRTIGLYHRNQGCDHDHVLVTQTCHPQTHSLIVNEAIKWFDNHVKVKSFWDLWYLRYEQATCSIHMVL